MKNTNPTSKLSETLTKYPTHVTKVIAKYQSKKVLSKLPRRYPAGSLSAMQIEPPILYLTDSPRTMKTDITSVKTGKVTRRDTTNHTIKSPRNQTSSEKDVLNKGIQDSTSDITSSKGYIEAEINSKKELRQETGSI